MEQPDKQPKWFEFHNGAYRNVILIGSYAIKVPRLVSTWAFIHGQLSNMHEAFVWSINKNWEPYNTLMCPVKFSLPFGLAVIMKRTTGSVKDVESIVGTKTFLMFREITKDTHDYNFGLINGIPVLIDYGGFWTD
jgi:hypothetical protein